MEKIGINEIADVIDGKIVNCRNISINRVVIDSRDATSGCLFWAIRGEKHYGGEFAFSAVEKGAAAVVLEKQDTNINVPVILVKNGLRSLQRFASYYRDKFSVKVIGITGSNGKTTTKEMLYSILSRKFKVLATRGNLNNHIGLPLTLLGLEKKHKYCVLEMGANHSGEIKMLCKIAKPHCGIITNIGSAHIGEFGSMKNILKAKIELFDSLSARGIAVINNDDPYIKPVSKKISCRKISFSTTGTADVRCSDILSRERATSFTMFIRGKKMMIQIPVPGIFNVSNALSASSAAIALNDGISLNDIVLGLRKFAPPKKRMEVFRTKSGAIIIDDAYNANPVSMRNAIENYSKIFYNRRKILVIGDMLELGRFGLAEHKRLGRFIREGKHADLLYTTGKLSEYTAIEGAGMHFKSKEELAKELVRVVDKGDAVFFKASRMISLEDIIAILRK